MADLEWKNFGIQPEQKKLAEPTVFGKEKNPHHSAVLGSL